MKNLTGEKRSRKNHSVTLGRKGSRDRGSTFQVVQTGGGEQRGRNRYIRESMLHDLLSTDLQTSSAALTALSCLPGAANVDLTSS